MTCYRHFGFLLAFCFCLLLGALQQTQAQSFTTLYSFSAFSSTNSNTDGANPSGALIQASDGNFYGTARYGGANSNGTIFKITPSGTFTLLHTFSANSGGTNTDGAIPPAALVQASDGNLYGAATVGGANGHGTLFKITPSGTFTTLHSFNVTDGDQPYAALMQASDGNLYGTTVGGGANNRGTLFKITPSATFTILYSFTGGTDGAGPDAALIQASDGNLYSTAYHGGANGNGTIFKITTSGTFTLLHTFSALSNNTNTDGATPYASLIQASDGNLYGTAWNGGANGRGTLFKITPSGTFTTLYSFSALSSNTNTDGADPIAALIQASDGNLYGTAEQGGANSNGTLFKITTSGTFTTLYSFSALSNNYSNPDGIHPDAALIQASDGNLYDTAANGGANGTGTIFSLELGPSAPVPSDFNGDGKPDLLFQNSSTGQLAVWYMNGITPSGGAFVTPSQSSAWKTVGDADFNGDGKPDILFQNTSTNQLALWSMNGVTATGGQLLSSTPPAGWNVVSLADFNGDGHPDLLLQNSSTGRLAIWTMNGATITGGGYVSPAPSSGWTAVGSGDFNADGKQDILLQNYSTGQLAVWYMNNNATATGGAYITPSQQAGWKCVSVIDLNADGHPDLLFQNTSTGKLVYWLLNGVQAIDGNAFSTQPQSGWQVVGPH